MHAFHVPSWLYLAFLVALMALAIAITLFVRDRRPLARWRKVLHVALVTVSGAVTLVTAFLIWLLRGLSGG